MGDCINGIPLLKKELKTSPHLKLGVGDKKTMNKKLFADKYNIIGEAYQKYYIQTKKNVFLDKIPTCTKDAINYGILKSIILPIQQISQNKQVYFTGGDGKVLSQIFTGSIFDEFIVFNGMRKIIKGIKC